MKRLLFLVCSFLSIVNTGWPQWNILPGFHTNCKVAILSDTTRVWGAGTSGDVFNINLENEEITYFQFDSSYDIHSIYQVADSQLILSGGDWIPDGKIQNGFILNYNFIIDSIIKEESYPSVIWDIEFINKDTGFFVSSSGIDMTVNGGNSWKSVWNFEQIGASYGELYSITCDSLGSIYASGRKRVSPETIGIILKSEDRGENWVEIKEIIDGYIVNLNYRFNLLYCYNQFTLNYYYSGDLGESWHTVNLPISDPLLGISDIELLSQEHILISISQMLYFSSDDPSREQYSIDMIIDSPDFGNTWFCQYINYSPFPPRDSSLNTLVSLNDTIIYAFGMNHALITKNQGGTDNPILTVLQNKVDKKITIYPNPVTDIMYIQGLDVAETYYICALNGQVLKSKTIDTYHHIAIPVATLKEGLYFLYLIDNNSVIFSSLFIKY